MYAGILQEERWILRVLKPNHNQPPHRPSSHPALRAIAMTREKRDFVATETVASTLPRNIIKSFRNGDEENPMIKRRDIYNVKAVMRAETLGLMAPVQALMVQLSHRDDWFVRLQKNHLSQRVEFLFFSRISCQKMLKTNGEVLIMDCTYKTNRYRMPLRVITGTTSLNTTFYVGFAFMAKEWTESYT